jgi:hypothetical protein
MLAAIATSNNKGANELPGCEILSRADQKTISNEKAVQGIQATREMGNSNYLR